MVDTSNEREPIDIKERNRQRARQRYAQMDKQKKDELLKKRREAYQQKKATKRVTQDSSSAPSQLQSTPIITGILYSYIYHFTGSVLIMQLIHPIFDFNKSSQCFEHGECGP
jgi:hypothetical protein